MSNNYDDWDDSDEDLGIVKKEGDGGNSGSEIDTGSEFSMGDGMGFALPSSTAAAAAPTTTAQPAKRTSAINDFDDTDDDDVNLHDHLSDDSLSSGRQPTGRAPLAAALASSAMSSMSRPKPTKAIITTNPDSDSDYDTDEQNKRREARERQLGSNKHLTDMLEGKKEESDRSRQTSAPLLEEPSAGSIAPPQMNSISDSDFDSNSENATDIDDGSSAAPTPLPQIPEATDRDAPGPSETPSPPVSPPEGPLFAASSFMEEDERSVSPPLGISYRENRENPFPKITLPETEPEPEAEVEVEVDVSQMKGGLRGIMKRREEAPEEEDSLEDSMELVNRRVLGRREGGADRGASPSPPMGIRRGPEQIAVSESPPPPVLRQEYHDPTPAPLDMSPETLSPSRSVSPLPTTAKFDKACLARCPTPYPPLSLSPDPLDEPLDFSRLDEFEKISPALIFVSPLSSKDIALHSPDHEAIVLYKCFNNTHGKFIIKKGAGADEFLLKWCTFNTILPGVSGHSVANKEENVSIYSQGECRIYFDATVTERNCFNFGFGGYGSQCSLGDEWNKVPTDLCFLREGGRWVLNASAGFSMHDYQALRLVHPPRGAPLLSMQDVFADVLEKEKRTRSTVAEETIEEFRWRPPHIVKMSDSGLEQIYETVMCTANASANGGLRREDIEGFMDYFFGRDLFGTMMSRCPEGAENAEDEDTRRTFFKMCTEAMKFSQSSVVHEAMWVMLTPNNEPTARVDVLIQLIDAVVVSQDIHVVSEFLVEVLFRRKLEVDINDVAIALEVRYLLDSYLL